MKTPQQLKAEEMAAELDWKTPILDHLDIWMSNVTSSGGSKVWRAFSDQIPPQEETLVLNELKTFGWVGEFFIQGEGSRSPSIDLSVRPIEE